MYPGGTRIRQKTDGIKFWHLDSLAKFELISFVRDLFVGWGCFKFPDRR